MKVTVNLRESCSKKESYQLVNKKRQIQISVLANSDLNEKGRQLPAGQSFFVKFLATNPYSPETNNPPIKEKRGELL